MLNKNAQEMSKEQVRELGIRMLSAMPLDMDKTTAQGWIQNPGALAKVVREALMPPSDYYTEIAENLAKKVSMVSDWQKFYRQYFNLDVDMSKVIIPKHKPGFDRLIVVAQGMTLNKAYEACQRNFKCYKYADDLDKVVPTNDRDPKNGTYAIWIRDRQEADKELKNLSANDLKSKNITGITLLERIILELKYFKETGKHLDIDNWTLCSGSRYYDSDVPRTLWYMGCDRFNIDCCPLDNSSGLLCARQVVS